MVRVANLTTKKRPVEVSLSPRSTAISPFTQESTQITFGHFREVLVTLGIRK